MLRSILLAMAVLVGLASPCLAYDIKQGNRVIGQYSPVSGLRGGQSSVIWYRYDGQAPYYHCKSCNRSFTPAQFDRYGQGCLGGRCSRPSSR